jgi:hypothetical protein
MVYRSVGACVLILALAGTALAQRGDPARLADELQQLKDELARLQQSAASLGSRLERLAGQIGAASQPPAAGTSGPPGGQERPAGSGRYESFFRGPTREARSEGQRRDEGDSRNEGQRRDDPPQRPFGFGPPRGADARPWGSGWFGFRPSAAGGPPWMRPQAESKQEHKQEEKKKDDRADDKDRRDDQREARHDRDRHEGRDGRDQRDRRDDQDDKKHGKSAAGHRGRDSRHDAHHHRGGPPTRFGWARPGLFGRGFAWWHPRGSWGFDAHRRPDFHFRGRDGRDLHRPAAPPAGRPPQVRGPAPRAPQPPMARGSSDDISSKLDRLIRAVDELRRELRDR